MRNPAVHVTWKKNKYTSPYFIPSSVWHRVTVSPCLNDYYCCIKVAALHVCVTFTQGLIYGIINKYVTLLIQHFYYFFIFLFLTSHISSPRPTRYTLLCICKVECSTRVQYKRVGVCFTICWIRNDLLVVVFYRSLIDIVNCNNVHVNTVHVQLIPVAPWLSSTLDNFSL